MSHLLSDSEKEELVDKQLLHRWNRISNPSHALELKFDLFYFEMCHKIVKMYGNVVVEIGKGNINMKCHKTLRLLAHNDEHFNSLMDDFLSSSTWNETTYASLKKYRPFFIWYQLKTIFLFLSTVLYEVYKAPPRTDWIERNHKIGNIVLSKFRCCINDKSNLRQIAVAHNATKVRWRLVDARVGYLRHVLNFLSPLHDKEVMTSAIDVDDDNFHEKEELMLWIQAMVSNIDDPSEIAPGLIFGVIFET